MSLLDSLTSVFAPYDCLGCNREGSLLCQDCCKRLPTLPSRCFRCRKLTEENRSCLNCRRSTHLHTVQAVTVYEGTAKDLVWHLKFQGAQAAAKLMAQKMAPLIAETPAAIIVPVPTATSRVRQRGYDQARLLARALSRETHLPMFPVLARTGQHHQVGAHRAQRLTQLATDFRVTHPALIRDKHPILIDDVLTTGATLSAAAHTLRAAGAHRVDALVFAQA